MKKTWELQERNYEIQGKSYEIRKLLGKGKGGYSYLVTDKENYKFVLKQLHHEPCDYYQFADKLEAEKTDYARLLKTGIRLPKLLAIEEEKEQILKEYIEGPTIYDLVLKDQMIEDYLVQVRLMCEKLYPKNLNIDYFPTNFVVQEGLLYYIDYECNTYMEEWNFENWGISYWSKTKTFLDYAAEHTYHK